MEYFDPGHPFRWRTWLRSKLPRYLINMGLTAKAQDCEAVGEQHWWYNADGENSACYHCEVVRPGQHWQSEPVVSEVRRS